MIPARAPTSTYIRAFALAATLLGAASAAAAPRATMAKSPIVIPAPKGFDAAVAAVEKATGAKAAPLDFDGRKVPPTEGRAFDMDGKLATRLITGSHAEFRKAGLYLFRHERSFGMGEANDRVVLLANGDRDAVIKLVGTRDPGKKLTTDSIVQWLGALDKEEPFDLDEIGDDFVAGHFKAVPKDPAGVARRIVAFSPELAKGGKGDALDLLVNEIKANRTLYLIW
jgi:hypothetical protein